MSLLGRSHVKVRAIKDGVVKDFDTRKACARYLGVTHQQVGRAIEYKMLVSGWYIETLDGEGVVPKNVKELLRPKSKVIGITPDGVKVRFSSVTDAANKMGSCTSNISSACRGGYHHGGWIWKYGDYSDSVELTDELKDTFSYGKKRYNEEEGKEFDPEEETPLVAGPSEHLEKGYFRTDENPTICPICHMVVSGTRHTRIKHLRRCIGDRPYRVKYGIISVLVEDRQ